VALARVLITQPSILLLDEPLSALDKKLREEMKYWIKDLQHRLAITTIYVTHDQGEALTMSDRIAVMNRGQIAQVGSPQEIYERPINRFVTDFIGESNILTARVTRLNGAGCTLAIGDFVFQAPKREGIAVDAEVSLTLRPEQILLGDEAETSGANKLRVRVIDSTYQGAIIRYRLDLAGQTVVAERPNRADVSVLPAGAEITVSWRPEATEILTD
jgi:ABC-type Fe3+/spermidine/putrescine transport system ATPase subunit